MCEYCGETFQDGDRVDEVVTPSERYLVHHDCNMTAQGLEATWQDVTA